MNGKVVTLRPRMKEFVDHAGGDKTWLKIIEFVQPEIDRAELCLQEAAIKAPAMIRDTLLDLVMQGERLCPVLFLTIAKKRRENSAVTPSLAASLEALHLALKVHRNIELKKLSHPPAKPILAGDFYFSLALSLAAEAPLFIKGMAEIITRTVISELKKPASAGGFRNWRKTYLQQISDGGASILALSATLGAWHGGFDPRQNETLAYFGHYVGMALQLFREQALYEQSLVKKNAFKKITLPLIYLVEQSTRRNDLLALVNSSSYSKQDHELLLHEHEKINPKEYMDQITGNCLAKARKYLDMLRGEVDSETTAALIRFVRLKALV